MNNIIKKMNNKDLPLHILECNTAIVEYLTCQRFEYDDTFKEYDITHQAYEKIDKIKRMKEKYEDLVEKSMDKEEVITYAICIEKLDNVILMHKNRWEYVKVE
jgi:hypothetical protein